ncbi:MAG: hypothetical protein IT317_11225 [Anaerolineales bacterium]|nr:hypothetical protein [Anaerolineales bacterium]
MAQPEREETAVLAPTGGGGLPPFMRTWLGGVRPLLALVLGNLCGWAAWRLGLSAVLALWQGQPSPGDLPRLITLTALSAIIMAGPPVLVGALAARLAGQAHLLVGVLAGLWALTLIRTVPAGLPIAPGLWYAPTVLVLFSGGMGGWTMSGGRKRQD